jgi:hypothetical protein
MEIITFRVCKIDFDMAVSSPESIHPASLITEDARRRVPPRGPGRDGAGV